MIDMIFSWKTQNSSSLSKERCFIKKERNYFFWKTLIDKVFIEFLYFLVRVSDVDIFLKGNFLEKVV